MTTTARKHLKIFSPPTPGKGKEPMNPRQKTFGATVRDRRTEINLSQQQVADLIGVTQPTVARWETDQAFPKPPELSPLAAALEMPLERLLEPLQTLSRQPARSTREEIRDINVRLDNIDDALTEILRRLRRPSR